MTDPTPHGDASRSFAASIDPGTAVEARRLAAIHLRLGSLLLARAELEDLDRQGALDVDGLADLAESRWRTGDLGGAETAAVAHLDGGGRRSIARIVAAEAAAAAGRPGEARIHVAALGDLGADDLGRLFAGMPQRAFWPSAPASAAEPISAFGPTAEPVAGSARRRRVDARLPAPGAEPAPGAGDRAAPDRGPGLWGDEGTDGGSARPSQPEPSTDLESSPASAGAALLARARDDLGAPEEAHIAAGLARLALALRLDPSLAPAVIDALGRRSEPGALVARGDALRVLGRGLEAEAAYAEAAAALDRTPRRGRR